MTLKAKRWARKECRRLHGNKCAVSGETENLSVHHIIPIKLGGAWNQGNLVLLANRIHKAIHETCEGLAPHELTAVCTFRQIIERAKRQRK